MPRVLDEVTLQRVVDAYCEGAPALAGLLGDAVPLWEGFVQRNFAAGRVALEVRTQYPLSTWLVFDVTVGDEIALTVSGLVWPADQRVDPDPDERLMFPVPDTLTDVPYFTVAP